MASGFAWTALAILATAADAADSPAIIVTAPLEGQEVPRDRFPADVQTVTAETLQLRRARNIAELADDMLSGVTINEAQSNPFQPDVSFRGFTASPLLGNPIGLSVFVDGVRINESFGDTVLWDLIPMLALDRVDLIPGANPVFGLNTLGGALSLRTRSGRDRGASLGLSSGSFGRRSADLNVGGSAGAWDGYAAASYFEEDGWRKESPSEVRQVFLKGGYTGDRTAWHLSYTRADNTLVGNGLAPDPLLEEQRDAVYTHPDQTRPQLDFLILSSQTRLREGLALSANAYWRRLDIETFNADAEFDDAGTPIDPDDDAYEAENRRTQTAQRTQGGTLQLSGTNEIGGRNNEFTVGLSVDRGRARFQQSAQEATFTEDRGTEGEGQFAIDTDVNGTNTYFGLYAFDSLALTPRLQGTASLRFNRAEVALEDRSGTEEELDGRHSFHRVNPALGLTYAINPDASGYVGYNEGSRAPTGVELACADENAPCSLPVGFVADPPLKAVTVRTWEAGLRGNLPRAIAWRLTVFASELQDDILFTAVGNSQGFFANVEATRRRGLDAAMSGHIGGLDWSASYSLVKAAFAANVDLFNPVSNAADPSEPPTIPVRAGDRLPGIPLHTVKLLGEYSLPRGFVVGVDVRWSSSQYLRGDEHNVQRPIPGYINTNLRFRYQATDQLRLFATVDNVFDRRYASLGARNRNAFDGDNMPLEGVGPGPVQRFSSPGTPRNFWLGFEYALGTAP